MERFCLFPKQEPGTSEHWSGWIDTLSQDKSVPSSALALGIAASSAPLTDQTPAAELPEQGPNEIVIVIYFP